MPAPTGLRRATINASILGGEIMAHNLYYRDISGAGNFAIQDHANTIRDAWLGFLTTAYVGSSVQSVLSASTLYTDVKLYDIDPVTAKTTDLAQAVFTAAARGTSTTVLPNQVALAVTLDTGQPGRTKRGRLYLGGFGSGLLETASGRLKATEANTIAQAFADFLQKSRDQSLDIDAYRPVVFSRVGSSALPILSVSIGNVMDTQRRRRDSLVEARTSAEVSTAT